MGQTTKSALPKTAMQEKMGTRMAKRSISKKFMID
jgi:hypothetical protein